MKVEDLMVGDWVRVPSELNRVMRIRTTFDLDSVVLYEPISLTPEILEKNGFKRVQQDSDKELYRWEFSMDDDELVYSITAFSTIFCGMLISIQNPSRCEPISLRKQIIYVHELQHALKVSEIDKEIIL